MFAAARCLRIAHHLFAAIDAIQIRVLAQMGQAGSIGCEEVLSRQRDDRFGLCLPLFRNRAVDFGRGGWGSKMPHASGGWRQPLTKDSALLSLPNVSIVGDDVHSIHLLNWADVIMDLATSVVFEAIKAGKPVLAADYLHAGRSTVAEYMPEAELRCRDDVYKRIDELISIGFDSFYVEEHRQHFLKEIINGSLDDNVLPRYVTLLEKSCCNGSEPA